MRCRAAILRGVGSDWEIREVDLDPPHAGEVLVRMAVAGICHSMITLLPATYCRPRGARLNRYP